jgi:hypothetical protein
MNLMKGDNSMKKITLLLTILAVVLAFGTAYAMEMTDGRTNGITVFAPGNYANVPSSPVARKWTEESAAGGVTEALSNRELDNGITIFAAGPVTFDSVPTYGGAAELIGVGSAAGGLSKEDLPMDLHNGITIFDKGPIVFDAD